MSDCQIVATRNNWEKNTIIANKYFSDGIYSEALSRYLSVLKIAEQLNHFSQDCKRLNIPFIQLFIISCNNLSNVYTVLGEWAMA